MYIINLPIRNREILINLKDAILTAQNSKLEKIAERMKDSYNSGYANFQLDNKHIMQYMEYIFSANPHKQVMNGKDYTNKILMDKEKLMNCRMEKSLANLKLLFFACIASSFIFSCIVFSSAFAKIIMGTLVSFILIKIVTAVMIQKIKR